MKKLLLITLLLSSMISYGQISEMLVDTTKLWSNLTRTSPGSPPPYLWNTSFIRFSNDTLIGTTTFKKVMESTEPQHQNYSPIGFIREDVSHKVFYRTLQDTAIRLLYDFNAQLGDSIHLMESTLVVDSVSTVTIDNKSLKRMVLSNNGCVGEVWIEGIGSLNGILASGSYCILGTMHDLLCYYQNDTLNYSNPEYNDCYYNTGIENLKISGINIILIPNPVTSTSMLTINGIQSNNFILQIYNLVGVKISTITGNSQPISIQRKDFAPGLYLYQLILSKQKVVAGKFIVE